MPDNEKHLEQAPILSVQIKDDNTSKTVPIEIKLDTMDDLSRRGIRRAYVFLGLGINAANDERLQDIHLPHDPTETIMLEFLPDETPLEQLEIYKKDFAQWITGNALRELIEFFGFYLDEVYLAALAVTRGITLSEIKDKTRSFEGKGPIEKLKKLEAEDIKTNFSDILESINKARNCLTHRSGLVGKGFRGSDDLNDGNNLTIRWNFMEGIILLKDGTEVPYFEGIAAGLTLQDGTPVIRKIQRQRTIPKGQIVELSTREIHEIMTNFNDVAAQVRDGLMTKMKSHGAWPEQSEKS